MNAIRRYIAFFICISVGILSSALMKDNAYKNVTQELIFVSGLVMAAVLPTMVLTASVLRPGNMSIKRLLQYQGALTYQIKIWIGLFLIAMMASIFVIIGKMSDWSLIIAFQFHFIHMKDRSFQFISVINGLISFLYSLILYRGYSVGNGVMSLMRLTFEISLGEAKAREEARHKERAAEISEVRAGKEFGAYIDLPKT
jgi:hypothetical protein